MHYIIRQSKTTFQQMKKIATTTTWKHEPIDKPKRIYISLHLTEKQFSKLTKGLIPQQMEDKWFVFYENDWLYFHRSWTGYGLYKAQLIKEKDGYSIKEFWAERNQEKYKNEDDSTDIETISFLIARGLLGIDVLKLYAEKTFNPNQTAKKVGVILEIFYLLIKLSSANSATIDTVLRVFKALKAEINFNVKLEDNFVKLA